MSANIFTQRGRGIHLIIIVPFTANAMRINCVPDIFPAEMCPLVYNCVPDILPAETVSRGAGLRLSKIECPRTLTRVRGRSRIMSSEHLFRGGCVGWGKYEESCGH